MFTESMVAEINKKIDDAFEVFDHDRGQAVDVRCSLLLLYLQFFLIFLALLDSWLGSNLTVGLLTYSLQCYIANWGIR